MDRQAPTQPYHIASRFVDRETPFVPRPFKADTHHRYCLSNGNGKGNSRPWLSLHLSSRSPKPEYLPMFIGKDNICGTVKLDLAKPETIREVKVTFTGEATHLTQEPHRFLELSQTLTKQSSGKLSGKLSLPFSFVLPDDVTIDESNWAMVYPLPPKFHEKGYMYIDYKIVVTVRRGMFSVDSSLMTYIAYLPETIAGRPSALREQAYLEGKPLPPPMLDQGGWKLLSPLKAVGTIVPKATVTAQLSIATPLSFALGTPIPLFLHLDADEAVRIEPNSIDVRLVRTLVTHGISGGVRKADVACAVFWPAPGHSPQNIKLWGEVAANRSLTPSFHFSKCSIRYSIALYPRQSHEQVKLEPLLEEEVLLTLSNAPSVVPRSQAPLGVTTVRHQRQSSEPSRSFPMDFGMVV